MRGSLGACNPFYRLALHVVAMSNASTQIHENTENRLCYSGVLLQSGVSTMLQVERDMGWSQGNSNGNHSCIQHLWSYDESARIAFVPITWIKSWAFPLNRLTREVRERKDCFH